jgi:poly [ADP-ribose] polymerase
MIAEGKSMAHMIEAAKTSRASCRTCKKPITKGELRFGEEVPNAFAPGEMTYNWHHLPCAAQKKPSALKQALEANGIEVPNKDELLQTIQVSAKSEKPSTLPYAEHAPTARALCPRCGGKIEKGDVRVAIPAEADAGAFMSTAPRYVHPGCAAEQTGEDPVELFEKIKANSLNLDESELKSLAEAME